MAVLCHCDRLHETVTGHEVTSGIANCSSCVDMHCTVNVMRT